jgi:CheY-like chemotaxis protein
MQMQLSLPNPAIAIGYRWSAFVRPIENWIAFYWARCLQELLVVKTFARPQFDCSNHLDRTAVSNNESNRNSRPPNDLQRQIAILLVEDTPINQKVTLKQLRNLGYEQCDCVSDGQQALDRLIQIEYDIVLMDCFIPKLDGYEVTRHLRQHQGAASQQAIAIALTASTAANEREKCLNAGMDDYLGKPIRLPELETILHRWWGKRHQLRDRSAASQSPPTADLPPLDPDRIPIDWQSLDRFSRGDRDFQIDLLQTFMADAPTYLQQARDALAAGDLATLARKVHQLKGGSAMAAIRFLPDIARTVEERAECGSSEGTAADLARVDILLAQVQEFLDRWLHNDCR